MDWPHVPREFVGGIAEMESVLLASGRLRGFSQNRIRGVLAVAPESLTKRVCFLDKLTSLWRYEFGTPFELPDGQAVFGSNTWHPVDVLFDVLDAARRRLPAETLGGYLRRVEDPVRHLHALAEFGPVIRLPDEIPTTYEVSAGVSGNQTVDWRIDAKDGPPLFVEVKHRIRDLMEHIGGIARSHDEAPPSIPAPGHDASLLFRSTEKKFPQRPWTEVTQVVWIWTNVKQDRGRLSQAFGELDPMRVHVAVLGDLQSDASLLATDAAAREHVIRTLRLQESSRFIFDKDSGSR